MSEHPTYRADIDGLRAISILLVVAFHAGLAGFAGGFVGVDVFFVLSGYLITGLLVAEYARNQRISLVTFFARRLRRLLPLACLVIVVTLVLGFWLLPPVQRPNLSHDAVAAAFYFANWRFAAQTTAYSDFAVTDGLLLHYWSLSVEEQFYVIWPLLVVAAAWIVGRRSSLQLVPILRVLIGGLVVVSFVLSVTVTADRGTPAYYFTHTRLWELGVGALLAVSLPQLRRLSTRFSAALALGGLVSIGVAALRYDATTPFPGSAALLPVLGTAAIIVAGREGANLVSRGLGRWPLPLLGRLSYAWYLWHWPTIGLALLYNERLGTPWSTGQVTALAVAGSLGLAAMSHTLVENPLRRSSWLQVDRRSLAFGLSLTLVPLAVGSTLVNVIDTGDRPVAIPATAIGSAVGPGTAGNSPPPAPMSAAEASEDTIELGRADCHSGPADVIKVGGGGSCVFGDPAGALTVALVGDSHAQHWLPAFDAAGQTQGWRVLAWTKSSCPAVDLEVWDTRADQVFDGCARWYDEVVERMRTEQVDVVVLGRSHNYRGVVVTQPGRRPGELDDERLAAIEQRWAEGLGRTFDDFLDVADDVIVLRDTPWSPVDVPSCLSTSADDPTACAFPLDGAAGLDREFHEIERAVAPDDVEFVDLTAAVCEADPCPVVTPEGVIKFSDRHHLTTTFSTRLGPALVDGLDLGGRPQSVPVRSSMTAAQAAADTTRLGWESCHNDLFGDVDLDEACVAGDPNGAITIALVGDSHAQHWVPLLDVLGQARGWRVLSWTKSACPAVDVEIWDDDGSQPYVGCRDWFAAVVERLADETSLDAVVLSRSSGYRGLIVGPEGRPLGGSGRPVPAAALELWQDGLRRTFDDYLTVADRVIVLRDTPWSPVDVPSCLSDSPDRPDDCAFDLAGAAHRDAELHAAELDIAPDGVDFLDLTAEICPDDPCQVVTETGVIKYRDQHHLTRTFALDLVPRIERRLSPLVERGP